MDVKRRRCTEVEISCISRGRLYRARFFLCNVVEELLDTRRKTFLRSTDCFEAIPPPLLIVCATLALSSTASMPRLWKPYHGPGEARDASRIFPRNTLEVVDLRRFSRQPSTKIAQVVEWTRPVEWISHGRAHLVDAVARDDDDT